VSLPNSMVPDFKERAVVLLQVKIRQLEELLKRVDLRLHNHIISHEVQYLQFSFRWMNNLLLRELPLSATVRLWDTYLAERDGFSKFHLYVCAAFLIRWKADLEQKKDFQAVLRIRIRIHRIRIHHSEVWIRIRIWILLSTSKKK
jgi:hypothetical protein